MSAAPGVYAVGPPRLRPEGRRLAAVLACGPGAVLSHRSAAAHWGLLATDQTRVDVAAPRSRDGVPGIRLHRPRCLDDRDTTTHEGIPITTIARTLLDLAATVRPDRLERALAQAERLQLYDHRAITDVLERSNGHRGTGALARATAQEPKLTRSELEARFLALGEGSGPDGARGQLLPRRPRPPSHTRSTSTSRRTTSSSRPTAGRPTGRRAAFRSDRRKDAALTAAGYRVMRFTYDDVVYEPDTVVARLTPRSAPA